jgi:hypothetical protein
MNVEIGTETPKFIFWEYLFRNFGILSLQCTAATLRLRILRNFLQQLRRIFLLIYARTLTLSPAAGGPIGHTLI